MFRLVARSLGFIVGGYCIAKPWVYPVAGVYLLAWSALDTWSHFESEKAKLVVQGMCSGWIQDYGDEKGRRRIKYEISELERLVRTNEVLKEFGPAVIDWAQLKIKYMKLWLSD
jgi:hypothetical protein